MTNTCTESCVKNLKIAVGLLYASLAIGLFNTIYTFETIAALPDVQKLDQMGINSRMFMIGVIGVTFVISTIFVVLISQGRNWARILYLICGIIAIPSTIGNIMEAMKTNVLSSFILCLSNFIVYAAIIMLFFSDAKYAFKKKAKDIEPEVLPVE